VEILYILSIPSIIDIKAVLMKLIENYRGLDFLRHSVEASGKHLSTTVQKYTTVFTAP